MRKLAILAAGFLCAAAFAEEAPAPKNAPAPQPMMKMEGVLGVLMQRVEPVLKAVDEHKAGAEAAPQGEPLVLDLQQAVTMALRQNGKALSAAEDVAVREAQVGQAKAPLRPQISGQTSYTYVEGLGKETVKIPSFLTGLIGGLGGGGLGGIGGGSGPDMINVQVGVQQVIYAGGSLRAAVKASKFLASSEEWKRQATLDQIEYDAKEAYYNCMLSLALIEVAKASVTTFERHVADANHMQAVGMASRFESLRAETELGARQTDQVSADTMSKTAFLNLRRILAIEEDRPIQLEGTLDWRPLDEPIETMIKTAREKRSELRALEDGLRAADENIEVVRGTRRPTIGAGVQYQHYFMGPDFIPEGILFSVQGKYDFYTGGKRKSQMLEAEAQKRSLEHQRAEVNRLVELDVRQSFIRVNEAIEVIRREKGTVALAEEGLRLSELRYEQGVGTPTDTLNAELALTQARTSLAQALRNYAVALASLDRATSTSMVDRAALGKE